MRLKSTYAPKSFSFQQGRLGAAVVQSLETARVRLWVATILFLFGLLAVFGRLVDLTLLRSGEELSGGARHPAFAAGRADITDRNGTLLATTLVTSSLYANAKKVQNPQEAAKKLVALFPQLKEETVLARLKSDKSFVWLLRHLTPHQQAQVLELGIPGLDFMRDYRRIYPQGRLASHVLGFTDIDNVGVAGVECSFDERLRTQAEPLRLSLDARLQTIMYDEIQKGIEEFGCLGGSGCLMDLKTGEVLAMASFPDFDPNKPTKVDNPNALFNKVTLGVYEMGSIMKIPNTAMALESGKLSLASTFDTSQVLKIGRFTPTDYRANHGVINIAEIFVHSSNKGSARIALALGGEHQKAFLKKIGALDPVTLELPEKGAPIVPKRWREDKVITISYGYGLSMGQLQSLTVMASLVRPWGRINPTLVAKETDAPVHGELLVSDKTRKSLLHLMRFVVTQGTSRKAQVPGYFIGGKTGTADLLENGRYNKQRVSSAFLGILGEDISSVRYIIVVRLDDPQRLAKTYGFNTAGWNVVPVAGRIMGRVAGVVGLLPREDGKILEPFFQNASFEKK